MVVSICAVTSIVAVWVLVVGGVWVGGAAALAVTAVVALFAAVAGGEDDGGDASEYAKRPF